MKKIIVALCAFAMMAGAVSCKKDNEIDPIEEERVPEYAEGVFNPVMQLSSVEQDGVAIEQYTWNGNDLTSIRYNDGVTANYVYENGKIAKVTANMEGNEEVRYLYNDNQLSNIEIYYDATKAMDMAMQHNEQNRISGANITVDMNFLSSLAGGLMGKGTAFENILGTEVAQSLVKMAKVAKKDNSKYALTNQSVTLALKWNGENVDTQYFAASLEVTLSSSDIRMFGDAGLFEIPEELESILPLIDMMGGLPFTFTLTDTVAATYDNYYNPNYCNLGNILSMDMTSPNLFGIFSLNNVVTIQHNGTLDLGMTFGGQTNSIMSYPIANVYDEYSYQYNDKKYPTVKSTTEGDIHYIYK